MWFEAIDYEASRGSLAFVSITAETEPAVRNTSRKVKNYIALQQKRAGIRGGALWSEARETKARDGTPKPNAHIVAPMPSAADRDKLIEGINSSRVYGDTLAEPVTDKEGIKGYCVKEMTSQAAFKTGVTRIRGSHPLPEGGDRVRVSGAVAAALTRSGRVPAFRRTYARSMPKSRPMAATVPIEEQAQATPQALGGALSFVPQDAPAVIPAPAPPAPIYAVQGFLFEQHDAPAIPVLQLIEEKRLSLGISQSEAGKQIGGLKQPGYSNAVVRRHDRLGAWKLNRALDFIKRAA